MCGSSVCVRVPDCVCMHAGIKDPNTFTRCRNFYMSHGCFEPDRRGRFSAGFLLRHDDMKRALTKWLLARVKRDINISDVRLGCSYARMHTSRTYTHVRARFSFWLEHQHAHSHTHTYFFLTHLHTYTTDA